MDQKVEAYLWYFNQKVPEGGRAVWQEYLNECDKYFDRGEEFNQLLNDALMGQMFDTLLANLTVEAQDKLPELDRAYPGLYGNIERVFKGVDGSWYPFYGLMNTDRDAFERAWEPEGGGGVVPSAGGVWKNHYVEEWTEQIKRAMTAEESRLNEIKDYALKAYEAWSYPLLNEELGARKLLYGNRCYDLLVQTFIEHNWEWAYKVFEMRVHEPMIIEEWRRNEEA